MFAAGRSCGMTVPKQTGFRVPTPRNPASERPSAPGGSATKRPAQPPARGKEVSGAADDHNKKVPARTTAHRRAGVQAPQEVPPPKPRNPAAARGKGSRHGQWSVEERLSAAKEVPPPKPRNPAATRGKEVPGAADDHNKRVPARTTAHRRTTLPVPAKVPANAPRTRTPRIIHKTALKTWKHRRAQCPLK